MAGVWTLPSWLLPTTRAFNPAPGLLVAPHLRLVRPLDGSGDVVWVADQLVLKTEVAVKFAPPPASAGARTPPIGVRAAGSPRQDAERLLRQARSAARLADPHLVQIFEQGQTKSGLVFLVTELLEGRSLRQQLLQGGPLSLADVHAVVDQAAGVLGKAHAVGLCHGSLRPEHLFLVGDARAPFLKIASFGDTTEPGIDTAQDLLAQAYVSPEQLLRATGSSATSDAWALAVVLYELLTTTLPFEAATAAGVSVAICNSQFSPPSQYRADLPASVDAWFARAFAPDPAARFRNVFELAREFASALTSREAAHGVDETANSDLEEEDFEDDERTRKWDLPSDIGAAATPALAGPRGAVAMLAPHGAGANFAPHGAGSTFAPQGAGALASRGVVAAALPGYSRSASAMSPGTATLGTLSAWLSSRAATLPVPLRARSLAARLPSKTKGLIAGALGGAALMLIVWGYQSWSADGDVVTTDSGATKPVRAATAGHPATTGGPPDVKDLPVLKMDQLRSVPDDEEPAEVDARPAPEARAFSAALSNPKAATPPARPGPASVAAPAPAARHKTTKPASTEGDCNPPYYFDSNNIRRLKLDCL